VPGAHSKGIVWLITNARQQPNHKVELDADGEIVVNGVLLKSIAMKKEGVYEIGNANEVS
jgi:hypothetical protein